MFFANPTAENYALKPCGNGWAYPAVAALNSDVVVAVAKGPAAVFKVTAAELRAALGVPASAALKVGASQEACAQAQPQTVTLTTNITGRVVGQTVALTATSTGNAALPITYSLVNTPATVATLSGSTLTLTGVGSVTVRARKAGNAAYAEATAEATFAVGQGQPVLTLPALPNKTYGDPALTLQATSTVPALPIGYSLVNTAATVATLSSNTITLVGAGTVTVRATQAGNANYLAAAPVERTFTVAKAPQAVNFAELADTDFAANKTVALAASSSAGLPVSYAVLEGPATVAGATLTLTGVGAVRVQARQAGTANYLAAEAEQTFVARGVALALNAGGESYSSGGVAYQAEGGYVTGGTVLDRPSTTITGTALTRLHQTERYGDFSYALPVPAGTYQVTLHFAELYFTAANQRVFDVLAEGGLLYDNLDIFALAGAANKAYTRTFTRTVADGALNLQFRSEAGKNYAQLCGLVVRRVSDGATASREAPAPSATAPVTPSVQAALAAFPNPSYDGRATLELKADAAQTAQVYVHDNNGYLVSLVSVPVQAGATQFRLPSGLPAGTYYLKTRLDGQTVQFTLDVR